MSRGPVEVFNITTNNGNTAVKKSLFAFLEPPTRVPLASELKNVYSDPANVKPKEAGIIAEAQKHKVPQLQLEQIDIEAAKRVDAGNEETSVLIPDYIKGAKRDNLILKWKAIVSGQAFTGSYLELYAQRWIDRARVQSVYDCQRDPQKSHLGETFKAIFLNSIRWKEAPGGRKTIFLKSKWNLSKVNALSNWGAIKEKAKGAVDVEPDIIVCDPATNTVYIIEMKIGNGKKDSGEEWNQPCRVTKLFEILWNEYTQATPGRSQARPPNIKMVFVGWAAKTPEDVVFTAPQRTMGRNKPVPVPYYTAGIIPPEWQVIKANAKSFGELTGVRDGFISKIIQELNWIRANGFYKAMDDILKNQNLLRERNKWLNNLTHETRAAVSNRKMFSYLTPLKRTAPSNTEARAANINKVLNNFQKFESLRRNLLNNAKQYNTAKVQQLSNILKSPPQGWNYTPNQWTVFANYASNNKGQLRPNRGAQVVVNLVKKDVGANKIKEIFKNVTFQPNYPINKLLSDAKAKAQQPVRRR